MSFCILFIDYSINWSNVIKKNAKLADGRAVVVEQAAWQHVHVESRAGTNRVFLMPCDASAAFTSRQTEPREISVDLLVVRNFAKGLQGTSYKNLLVGFALAGVPAINSIESLLVGLERPLMYAELLKVQRRLGGAANFPVVPLVFHANLASGVNRQLLVGKGQAFPLVCKVSSTHAGFGKSIVRSQSELDDLMSILALNGDYFTVEPFVAAEFEFRLQQIGAHRRAFRRTSTTNWKNNHGDLVFVDHAWQPKYDAWMDACSNICGGLDMFAIDVLHSADGSDVVLEMNDTAFGLMFEHEAEDLQHIAELVLLKANAL